MPRGNTVENFILEIRPGGFFTVNQEVLDALFNGNFFVRILSDNFPEGEIIAVIQRFGETNGEEIPEEELTLEQIDRDVIRFLNQSTFGATENSYNELRAQIDDNGSNRLQIYEEWIDSQLDMLPTNMTCLLYTSPSPRDLSTSRMPSSA